MTNTPQKQHRPHSKNNFDQSKDNRSDQGESENITQIIIKKIDGLQKGLKDYCIRELVKDAETFGKYLKDGRLETNQIRKFLDAINQIKTDLANNNDDFSKIETAVVMLKPKLAYAAARQKAAEPLSRVICKAVDKVHNQQDFERFVQLIESIIAYHKVAGGK